MPTVRRSLRLRRGPLKARWVAPAPVPQSSRSRAAVKPRGPEFMVATSTHRTGLGRCRIQVAHDGRRARRTARSVSYTHLRAHETVLDLVCRLLLEKKKNHT